MNICYWQAQIADWFQKTVLSRIIHAPKQLLSSQRFWDNADLVYENGIQKLEEEFSELVTKKYGLHNDCLIYDTTNFFTYVNTMSVGHDGITCFLIFLFPMRYIQAMTPAQSK